MLTLCTPVIMIVLVLVGVLGLLVFCSSSRKAVCVTDSDPLIMITSENTQKACVDAH